MAATLTLLAAITVGPGIPPHPIQPAALTPAYQTVDDWTPLILDHFHPEDFRRAQLILECESGGDRYADNPTSTALGGWQFLRSTWDWVAAEIGAPSYRQGGPNDPEWSTRAAAWLAYNGGWQHWLCDPGPQPAVGLPAPGLRPRPAVGLSASGRQGTVSRSATTRPAGRPQPPTG